MVILPATSKKQRGRLPERHLWDFVASILAGLSELHERLILHLDLKPANVFLKKVRSGPGERRLRALMCDLGFARELTSSQPLASTMGVRCARDFRGQTLRRESPTSILSEFSLPKAASHASGFSPLCDYAHSACRRLCLTKHVVRALIARGRTVTHCFASKLSGGRVYASRFP